MEDVSVDPLQPAIRTEFVGANRVNLAFAGISFLYSVCSSSAALVVSLFALSQSITGPAAHTCSSAGAASSTISNLLDICVSPGSEESG